MVKVKLKFNKYKTSTLSGLRSESMVTLSLKKGDYCYKGTSERVGMIS